MISPLAQGRNERQPVPSKRAAALSRPITASWRRSPNAWVVGGRSCRRSCLPDLGGPWPEREPRRGVLRLPPLMRLTRWLWRGLVRKAEDQLQMVRRQLAATRRRRRGEGTTRTVAVAGTGFRIENPDSLRELHRQVAQDVIPCTPERHGRAPVPSSRAKNSGWSFARPLKALGHPCIRLLKLHLQIHALRQP